MEHGVAAGVDCTNVHVELSLARSALKLNARLPPGRILAEDLRVARYTVDAAFGQLVADGYVIRRRNADPVLSQRARDLKLYPGHYRPISTLPFAPSLPPIDLFPPRVWNRLMSREAARTGSDYREYGASNGFAVLREAIAAHSGAMRATHCSPEQVIVVTSTQQAVDLPAKCRQIQAIVPGLRCQAISAPQLRRFLDAEHRSRDVAHRAWNDLATALSMLRSSGQADVDRLIIDVTLDARSSIFGAPAP